MIWVQLTVDSLMENENTTETYTCDVESMLVEIFESIEILSESNGNIMVDYDEETKMVIVHEYGETNIYTIEELTNDLRRIHCSSDE